MVKRIACALVALALLAGSMFAGAHPGGIARELALGGGPLAPTGFGPNIALNPFIYDDPTLMLLNPAYQQLYRNYAWMNIAGGAVSGFNSATDNGYGRQFAGTNFSFGKDITLGAILSFDPSFANAVVGQLATFINTSGPGSTALRPGGAQTGLRPVDVFEVTGTFDLGNITFGAGILYGWAKNDAKNVTNPVPPASSSTELSASVFGVRLGAIVDMGGGSAFDASGAFRMDKATDKVDGTNAAGGPANLGDYSESATEIQLEGRLKLKMSNKVNFIPYAAFGTFSGEPKQDAPQTGVVAFNGSTKVSAMLLSLGAGMEYKISNFYFAGGLTFRSSHVKSEITPANPPVVGTTTVTNSSTEFPVLNMGVEWTLLDWLIGRMGYYRTFQSVGTKTERPSGASTTETDTWAGNSNVLIGSYNGPDNSLITLGLGLRFGNFSLDGTVSEEAIRRGLGLVGAQDNINTFGYLTASYCFD
ncbi:MAG TPA: hypothetical protein VK569_06630 [Bacteroidota bacterium]|nr:hypothetical protein [Bacteroidota bacterium]